MTTIFKTCCASTVDTCSLPAIEMWFPNLLTNVAEKLGDVLGAMAVPLIASPLADVFMRAIHRFELAPDTLTSKPLALED